jgi:hypothetical protein
VKVPYSARDQPSCPSSNPASGAMMSVKKYPHIIVNETMKSADQRAAAESRSVFLICSTIFYTVFDLFLE